MCGIVVDGWQQPTLMHAHTTVCLPSPTHHAITQAAAMSRSLKLWHTEHWQQRSSSTNSNNTSSSTLSA